MSGLNLTHLRLAAARATLWLVTPLDRPTGWAARHLIAQRLHDDGLSHLTGGDRPGPARLRLAATVDLLAQPTNRLSLWAAQTVTRHRVTQAPTAPCEETHR